MVTNKRLVAFRLPVHLIEQLDQISQNQELTRSGLLRKLTKEFILGFRLKTRSYHKRFNEGF